MTKSVSYQPLVTVYMPTYNRVELLQRAVDSVLNQDYRDIELIVVDDSSTDGTHEFLSKMADEDPRFKYFINDKNSGACVSRNKAIFAASGEFITGLDDDDYFHSNHISGFVEKCHLIGNDCVALYSNTHIKKEETTDFLLGKKIRSCTYSKLLTNNWIGNQIFTKTIYLKQVGGFEESIPAWQDLECWYRLLKHHNKKAVLIPKYSYVVDISHPHERISTKKKSYILEAYKIFTKKHSLSYKERTILKLHLNSYVNEPINFLPIIFGFIHHHDIANTKRTLKLLGSNLKKTIANRFN